MKRKAQSIFLSFGLTKLWTFISVFFRFGTID